MKNRIRNNKLNEIIDASRMLKERYSMNDFIPKKVKLDNIYQEYCDDNISDVIKHCDKIKIDNNYV